MAFHPSSARFPNAGPPGWAHPQAVHFGATADHPMLQPAATVRASSARQPTSRHFGLQTPARYGSGAVNHPPTAPAFVSPFQRTRRHRSNSRDRGFRGRDRHRSPDVRTNPTGPVTHGTPFSKALIDAAPQHHICSANKFEDHTPSQWDDPKSLANLSVCLHHARNTSDLSKNQARKIKKKLFVDAAIVRDEKFILSSRKPHSHQTLTQFNQLQMWIRQ